MIVGFKIVLYILIEWLPNKQNKKKKEKKKEKDNKPRRNRKYFNRQRIPIQELR